MFKHSLLFVFNPTAGREELQTDLFEVVNRFTKNGFLVTSYPTQKKRDAYEVIKAIGSQFDYIVCSGGDGTLNESVDAIMLLEKKPIFGYIPAGTTNDFANSLGLHTNILLATDTISQGVPKPIDVGQFQNEFFSYIAAFGLFTDVSYGTPQNMKNMFGHAAYVLEGVRRLSNIKSWHCTVDIDGEIIEDDFIFGTVTNSASIGGFELPALNANPDREQEFELILLRNINNLLELQDVVRGLLGSKIESDHFLVSTFNKVTITSETPLDWTLDGEYGGSFTTNEITIHKDALNIMVPEKPIHEFYR